MATTHDYRKAHCRWGWDIGMWHSKDGGLTVSASGWGRGLSEGDFILLSRPDGGESRYAVEQVSYYRDPPDMWSAQLKFSPRPPLAEEHAG
jgi:hypothetical protein